MKKKRSKRNGEDSEDGFGKEGPERPMSWEGELSDAEMSIVTGGKADSDETMEGVQNSPQNNCKPINFADNIVRMLGIVISLPLMWKLMLVCFFRTSQ